MCSQLHAFRSVAGMQGCEQGADMYLDRVFGQEKAGGDLLVGITLRQQ